MRAFQSMKSVDDGTARRDSHNDLVDTFGDFSLPQSYTYVPEFLLAETFSKKIWSYYAEKNRASTPAPSNSSIFHY